jgi:hypothetical protein
VRSQFERTPQFIPLLSLDLGLRLSGIRDISGLMHSLFAPKLKCLYGSRYIYMTETVDDMIL